MKILLTESNSPLSFRVKSIREEIKPEIQKNGMMLVKRIPSTLLGKKNANGRIYSERTVQSSLKQARERGLFENRQLLCTGDDHPDTTFPKPIHASHICVDAYIENVDGEDVLFNDWLVLNTENGKNLRALMEAGGSIGTSIRGLGRQDESTGEILEYEYLGTDVVGNPSSGTFAPFAKYVSECVVEPVSEKFVKTVIESLNLNSQGTNMFVLSESIDQFNKKYNLSEASKIEVTPAMISEIIAIEKKVNFDDSNDVNLLESWKCDILGETPKSTVVETKSVKTAKAQDEDILNKYSRQLESTKVIADYLKTQNESLLEKVEKLEKFKESSNKLVASLVEKAKLATDKLEAELSTIEEGKQGVISKMKATATKIVEDLQLEAKEIIQEKENQLEAAIQFGNLIADHFNAQKAINECLVERLKRDQVIKVSETKKVDTKESKFTEAASKPKYNRYKMSTWQNPRS